MLNALQQILMSATAVLFGALCVLELYELNEFMNRTIRRCTELEQLLNELQRR